jgi:hypothetical protein
MNRLRCCDRWSELVASATTRDAGKTIKMFCRSLGLLNSLFFSIKLEILLELDERWNGWV